MPFAPTNVAASDVKQTQAKLFWDANFGGGGSPILKYTVTTTDVGTGAQIVQAHDLSTNEVIVTGLQPNKQYRMDVAAENSVGKGPNSLPFTIRTPPNAAPDMNDAPVVKLSGSSLKVTWNEPWNGNSPITAYHVRFSSKNGQYLQYNRCADGLALHCEFDFEPFRNQFELGGGDMIVAHISATNAIGKSELSEDSEAIELPRSEDIAPEITFEDVTGDSLSINFKANPGISEYYINVDKFNPATGKFEFDKRIKKTVDEEPARRMLSGRRLAEEYSCPSSSAPDSVSESIEGLEAGATYRFAVEVAGTVSAPVETTTQ